ncbi:MAG: tetratricopeptide repeat protein, partial [Erysipelotrichia bacterium]|nr:tetratricopeptide repeat protein [Erysipelotrichia bacterium]
MTKKGMAVCLFFLFLLSSVFGADDENSLLKRSQLLVQKGEKAEERGNIEDAVASYEEAYNLYPKNIMPLLSWGRALSRIGMHKRAAELLEKIPVDKLPSTGQSEVHLLLSR